MSTGEIETKAKAMGWAPKEQWRGDPEKFVDAETFVQRGEEILPILRANNKKLETELGSVRTQLNNQEKLLKASAESMEELKNFNSSMAKERAGQRKEELKAALKTAREAGDVDAEVEITQQLAETTEALKVANKPKTIATETATGESPAANYMQTPEWKGWIQDNPWFGSDKVRTSLSMGVAEEIKGQANPPKGREFLDAVSTRVEEILGGGGRQASKVDGGGSSGGNSGGGGGGGGKRFSDLPADAKDACKKQGVKLIGPGRSFKTEGEWQKYYVSKYFEET